MGADKPSSDSGEYVLSRSGRSDTIFRLRYWLSKYPFIFLPYLRLIHSSGVLNNETQLLIEGYCRSAQSFAAECFIFANQKKVKVVWNMHVAAQVIGGSRMGLPILVLIRQPKDVVISQKVMNQNLSMETILKCYISYYEQIKEYASYFVVATRDQVNSDFGHVTRRINKKFNTEFAEFDHTQENHKAVINYMKSKIINEYGENWNESVRRTISYPDTLKDKYREECVEDYNGKISSKYISQADKIYKYYSSLSN